MNALAGTVAFAAVVSVLAAPLPALANRTDPFAGLRPSYRPATAKALGYFRARRFRKALAAVRNPEDDAGRLLEARCLSSLGRWGKAAERFEALAGRLPLLADHLRARAARALLNAGKSDRAAAVAAAVTADTAALRSAVLVAAEAHLASGRAAEARREARRFVSRWPKSSAAAAALWIEQRAESKLGRHREARAIKRRIYVDYPASRLARRAGKHRLTPEEALRRARRLSKVHRNRRASRELRRLLRRRRLSRDIRCRARFRLGRALQRLRRHRGAYASFRKAAAICKSGDVAARALYLWGKGLLSRRSTRGAATVLTRLAKTYPKHRLADDGWYLSAQAWRRARRWGRARKALGRLLESTPDGDMVPKGRLELALLEVKDGQVERAKKRLDELASVRSLGGRPLYVLGRIAARAGDRKGEVAAYRRCTREYPLSYWSALARGRLKKAGVNPGDDRLGALPADATPDGLPWPPVPNALNASPAFRRGALLIRLGAGDLAGGEIRAALEEAGKSDEVKAVIALVHYLAGDWFRSHRMVRWQMKHVVERAPTPDTWRIFLLAYPRGFWPVIEKHSRRYRLDPLFLAGLIREESAFNPTIESWANAVGLGQLIWPTAKRLARALRIVPFRRWMLLDPEINLRLASKYLSNLLRRFRGSAPLAVAGYNAGELAVERWLRRRRRVPLDVFVDRIPYEQTRHYTRRVMGAYATYRYLYGKKGERLLALGPSKRGPRRRRRGRRKMRRRRGRKLRRR